jgi:pyruvate dehydrogenase E2 component (dihydrolipoamide acetyltransferase)
VYQFKLPDLGEGIHEGEILQWHVLAGDEVAEDAPLVDVETDKAAVTIPSPRGGRLVSRVGEPGDTVTVGQVIAVVDDGSGEAVEAAGNVAALGEKPTSAPAAQSAPHAAATPVAAVSSSASPPLAASAQSPWGSGRPVPAAPATRRLAREMGVDLHAVPPTGPAGRVIPEDVKLFAAGGAAPHADADAEVSPATAASAETELVARAASAIPFLDIEPLPDFTKWGPVETEPLRSIRRKVAHRMTTSMILVPHVAHMDEADVTLLEDFRKQEASRRAGQPGGHLTLLSFVVKAVTAGLRAAPAFNASLDPFNETIIYKRYYNIGIAVDTGRGLVVPVVRDTDRKSIIGISSDIEDLATRSRDGSVDVNELRGGTFTITNVGPLGGTALIPTINYPEVAILGMGRVQEKPVVRDGEIVIRKMLPLTLAFDHRMADGADAARFVAELVRQLSDPNRLLLEA